MVVESVATKAGQRVLFALSLEPVEPVGSELKNSALGVLPRVKSTPKRAHEHSKPSAQDPLGSTTSAVSSQHHDQNHRCKAPRRPHTSRSTIEQVVAQRSHTQASGVAESQAVAPARRFRDRIRQARRGLETERSERLNPPLCTPPQQQDIPKKKIWLLPRLEASVSRTATPTSASGQRNTNVNQKEHGDAADEAETHEPFRSKLMHRHQIVAFRDTKPRVQDKDQDQNQESGVVVVKARLGKTETLWIEKQMQFTQRINLLDRECRGFLNTFRLASSFGESSAELVEMVHTQVATCERERQQETMAIHKELTKLKLKAKQLEAFVSQLAKGQSVEVDELEDLLKRIEDSLENFRGDQRHHYDHLVVEEKLLERDLSGFMAKMEAWDQEDAQEKRQQQFLLRRLSQIPPQQPQQVKELERRLADDKQDNLMIRKVRRIDRLLERSGGLLGGWDEREHGLFLKILRRSGLSDKMMLKHHLIASKYAMQVQKQSSRNETTASEPEPAASERELFEQEPLDERDDENENDPEETMEEFLSQVVNAREKEMVHAHELQIPQQQLDQQPQEDDEDKGDQEENPSRFVDEDRFPRGQASHSSGSNDSCNGSPVFANENSGSRDHDRYENLVARFLTSCMDQIVTQTSHGIRQHFEWYVLYLTLVDEKKRVIGKWRNEKNQLRATFTQKGLAFGDNGSLMAGAETEAQPNAVETEQAKRQRKKLEQKLIEWRRAKHEKEQQQQQEQEAKLEEEAQKQAARKQRHLETKQKVLLYKLRKEEETTRLSHLKQLQTQPSKPSPKINQLLRERSLKALEEAKARHARRLEMQLAHAKNSWQNSSFGKRKSQRLGSQRSTDNLLKPTKASAARRLTKNLLMQQEQERILQSAHDTYFPGMEAGREVKLKSFGHVSIQPRATPLWRRNL